MASCSLGCDKDLSKAKPTCFVIIISDKKLLIPKSFVREHGNGLSSPAALRVRDGTLWKVELDKDGVDDVWLGSGWQEFKDNYSLKERHLVFFEYEGNSKFSVVIFDTSATEIDYPVRLDVDDQDLNFDESEETSDAGTPKRKPSPTKRGGSKLPSSPPQKKMTTESDLETSESESWNSESDGIPDSSSQEDYGYGDENRKYKKDKQDNSNALKRARCFKSRNPFFMVIMWRTYLSGRNRLNIPARDSRKYFTESEGQCILRVPCKEKIWRVKYILGKGRETAQLARGWKHFTRDNHLETGDICIFELIGEVTFKVNIFRVAEPEPEEECCCSGGDEKTACGVAGVSSPSSTTSQAPDYASKFVSDYPFFQVVITATYLRQPLYLPASFVRRHMKQWNQKITLQFEEKSWPCMFSNSNSRIQGGWITFTKDNSLQQGDVCIFELVDRCKSLIKVSIFRSKN